MKLRFLGTGTSTGIPQVGCHCKVCKSENPKDKRLRTSVLCYYKDKVLLIDCGPDFREQMLRYMPSKIDAVLITHEHFDHVGGLDDLRPFCYPNGLSLYGEKNVLDALTERLPYCFREHPYPGVPHFFLHEIEMKPFEIETIPIIPIRIYHYKLPIVGYRIGNMAYITDMKYMLETEYEKIKDLEVLVINGLRYKEHISHQTLQDALRVIERVKPKKSFIIHMSHDLGLHEEVSRQLPSSVYLAYDNLEIKIKD